MNDWLKRAAGILGRLKPPKGWRFRFWWPEEWWRRAALVTLYILGPPVVLDLLFPPPIARGDIVSGVVMDRRGAVRGVLLAALALAATGFVALGIWQVQRLHWKRALVARVDGRIHAPAQPPPPPASWPGVSAARDEYRHVVLRGRYLAGRQTRVQALTELGTGASTPLIGGQAAK